LSTAAQRTQRTYLYERLRAPAAGILEAAATLFLLMIAVRFYNAANTAKGVIAGGGSLGLLIAPWLVQRVERAAMPVSRATALLSFIGGASYAVMALIPTLPVFVVTSVLALTTSSASIPLLTQMYQDNYPERERGKLFSRTMMLRIGTAAAFSYLGGEALEKWASLYRWLPLVFANASIVMGACLLQCPSRPLTASGGTHPFHAFRYLRQDRIFRQTIISWIFLGFATLMMAPLRVEYLANPKYGVQINGRILTAFMVTLLTGFVPNSARLVLNPVWGWLFDKMNFFVLRITLNCGFILGIVSFFITGSLGGLVIGAILFGISNAGADVAWGLWVTKFAPPDRVADYMSVHTFFTGVRGVAAPLVAFFLVSRMSPYSLAWVSVALIVIASSFLVPEIKFGRTARPAAPPVEGVAD
jgi:MFS family permease